MNFNSRTHVECDAFPFRTTFSLSNFNSRTHVECDYDCIDCHVEYYNISTHALTWSATRRVCCNVEQTKFQLTHSRGVRPGLIDVCPGCKNFNSRTHVECDLGYITSKDLLDNFNSRTHVECDEICLANRARKAISTHALTWSATFTYSRHPIRKRISTHALTWSATSINHLLPRPKRISTHALTWSATPDQFAESYKWNFNSRTHVECDWILRIPTCGKSISTHALTWSATCGNRFQQRRKGISTHALTWSATIDRMKRQDARQISTHALTWSATASRSV